VSAATNSQKVDFCALAACILSPPVILSKGYLIAAHKESQGDSWQGFSRATW
jgi:hypothetical protein